MFCHHCGFTREQRQVKPCSFSDCKHEVALLAEPDKAELRKQDDLQHEAVLAVVEAAQKTELLYFSERWPAGHGADYQYRDKGELHKALKALAALPHICPKHPGASPPCSEDACECYGRAMDLAGAYQSILDGRM